MKNKLKFLRKITVTALFATAAVSVYLFIFKIIADVIYAVGYNHEQYFEFDSIMIWLKSIMSAVIPLAYHLTVAVLSVMLAIRLLKNNNETLLLRIFCIINAADCAYLVVTNGLFNQITYFGESLGNLNLLSVQRLITAALLIAIAVLYNKNCSKPQANVLVILSVVQYLIYTSVSIVRLIILTNLQNIITPVYSTVISIIAAVLAYLPLLLICILKRIDSHEEEL